MTLPATHVWGIATLLRDQVIDIYSDAGLSLPGRRYVSEGAVAIDCELMAVELRRVFRGLPLQENVGDLRCIGLRTAEFHIFIFRCASVPQDSGAPPSTGTIESFAQPIYTDAWVLPSELQYRVSSGTYGFPGCENILVGNLDIVGPEGGFGGVDLTVEWQLG